jgi:hypothetical protein
VVRAIDDTYRIGYLSRYAVRLHQKRQKLSALLPLCPAFVRRACFPVPKKATLTLVAFQPFVIMLDDLRRRQHRPLGKRFPDRRTSTLADEL